MLQTHHTLTHCKIPNKQENQKLQKLKHHKQKRKNQTKVSNQGVKQGIQTKNSNQSSNQTFKQEDQTRYFNRTPPPHAPPRQPRICKTRDCIVKP